MWYDGYWMEFKEYICTYCGEPADTKDHVIPVSWNHMSRKNADYSNKKVVPACNQCNLTLGNIAYHTIQTRASYLIQKYMKKYKKLLKSPIWTPEEISELGRGLRGKILELQMERRNIQNRLDWLTVISLSQFTISDIWDFIYNPPKPS